MSRRRMSRRRRLRRSLLLALLVVLAALLVWAHGRRNPEDVPWTALDLGQPVGAFTARKLAALGTDAPRCRALLARAGVRFRALPPRADGPQCGYDGAVRFTSRGSRTILYRPDGLGTECAVAAALMMWEWNFVQPAAQRRFGRRVASIEHFGSYSCRRMYGRGTGPWSEHARANALDVAAFVLGDGRRISVAGDWRDNGAKGAFLHDVRDGACHLFATTLSPDYNAAHRDHLHLDEAGRGQWGLRACR
jgi:hypothetical protein